MDGNCWFAGYFGLQYVWLVNTYKLAKESIQFRSNEVFKDASM